jgi:hypothetical protein
LQTSIDYLEAKDSSLITFALFAMLPQKFKAAC